MAERRAGSENSRAAHPGPRIRDWLIVFAAALLFYAVTANRGAQWQDSGLHILRAVEGTLEHPLGLALVHPLHHWLARLAAAIPFIPAAFAVTLISALAGAVVVANVFGCVRELTGRRHAAFFAAGSLAIAHGFWKTATIAETYTLTAALLSIECWCVAIYVRRGRPGWLMLMAAANGLNIANHMLGVLTTPMLAFMLIVAARRVRRPARYVAAVVVIWLAATLPYSGLVVLEMLESGDIVGTMRSALFGKPFADEVLNVRIDPRMLLMSIGALALSFPNLLLPFSAVGVIRGRQSDVPKTALHALTIGGLIHAVFTLRYPVVDQFTFFVPLEVILCVLGGVGYYVTVQWRPVRWRSGLLALAVVLLLLTPVWYAMAPVLGPRIDLLNGYADRKPYRNEYVYVFVPWSVADKSAERMAEEALRLAGPNGVIVAEDEMASFALRYLRQMRKSDAPIQVHPSDEEMASLGRAYHRIVLVPSFRNAPRLPAPEGTWRRIGDLYVWERSDP